MTRRSKSSSPRRLRSSASTGAGRSRRVSPVEASTWRFGRRIVTTRHDLDVIESLLDDTGAAEHRA